MATRSLAGDDNPVRPIVAVYVSNCETGEREVIYALLDTGSNRDFLSLRTARRLGLKTWEEPCKITTLKGTTYENGKLANFQLESINGEYVCDINDAILGNLPVLPEDVPPARRDISTFSHLQDLQFDEFEGMDGQIDVVIGIGHAKAFVPREVREGANEELSAWKTKFGVAGKKRRDDFGKFHHRRRIGAPRRSA